ncbi:MAG TPA: hypothetical protein VIF10_04960 [Methylobacter sp.]|jgi:hypothetical protein
MLNFHIIKVNLKSGEARYRTILTQSGKGIKTKTFRRKQDARTWGNRAVLDSQEYEAKGIKPCTIQFSRLADEYMRWWTGKDHDWKTASKFCRFYNKSAFKFPSS